MTPDTPHPYYLERRPQILAQFERSLELASADFARLLPDHPIETLRAPLAEEFDRVLARLPYVGGAEGRMTPFFEQNTGVIAIGRVLRGLGVPLPTIFTLMRKTYLAELEALPRAERLRLGRQWLSRESQAYLQAEARNSARRENAGDFVYEYVASGETEDGERFDFGLNYHECGFCKLFEAAGDEDLLPSICAMDKEVYALRGIELFRSKTLAGGDSHCNFRFRAAPPDDGA